MELGIITLKFLVYTFLQILVILTCNTSYMKYIIPALFLAMLTACQSDTQSPIVEGKVPLQIVKINREDTTIIQAEKTIDFARLQPPLEREDAGDSIETGFTIAHPELEQLKHADDVALPAGSLQVYISYPLKKPVIYKIPDSKKPYSYKDLAILVSNIYKQIYKEEEQSAHVSPNGKYGIWGHAIEDLYLHSIIVKTDDIGNRILILEVES